MDSFASAGDTRKTTRYNSNEKREISMNCPNCGSPVTVQGNHWECSWCGDFGDFLPLHTPEQAVPNQGDNTALKDLERGVLSILEGIQEYFGNGEEAEQLACRLAVYGMSHALLPAKKQTQRNGVLLQSFFQNYPFCTAEEVLRAAHTGRPAFEAQFLLTEEQLGSFWASLLPKLPRYEACKPWPNWLFQTVDGLSQIACFFSGEGRPAQLDALQNALNSHWRAYPILQPDRAALEAAVRRWDFSENEWICRDLLIAAFPDTVGRWTVEELLKMDTMELLLETGEQDPNTAIQMMKLLLDTAEEHLQETEAAEQLLGNDLYDFCQNESIQPKLLAQLKQDDRLARQLFQSAYADSPQEELIAACDRLGEQTLKAHLQALLDQNPFC